MIARVPITLSLAAVLCSAAAISFIQATPTQATATRPAQVSSARSMPPVNDLAAPLLQREFTSTCVAGNDGFYRETLRFAEDATTTFVRQYFADAGCKQVSDRTTVQEGRFAVAREEAGQLLLMVRNLYDEKSASLTPYFEALIQVDGEQLVMQSSPSTSLHYKAQVKSI